MDSTNTFATAKETAGQYVAHIDQLLAGRDPWQVQEELFDWLLTETASLTDAQLRTPEKPGKWSVIEVIQHMADAEIAYGYRYRMILANPGCKIIGFDQDAWCREGRYREVPYQLVIDQLRAMRRANHWLLRGLTADQWQRSGMHNERGEESVRRVLELLAGHDLLHRNQILRIKKAIGARSAES